MTLCNTSVVVVLLAVAWLLPPPGVLPLLRSVPSLLLSGPEYVRNVLQVGGGFASKGMCAGVFISGRSAASMHEHELYGLASFFPCTVDLEARAVHSSLLGTGWFERKAQYLGPRLGCQLLVMGSGGEDFLPTARVVEASIDKQATGTPLVPKTKLLPALQQVLEREFSPAARVANQSRAVVIMHHGVVVGERYQDQLGISATTKLLGWSMTKSVHAMMIGVAIEAGLLTLQTPVKLTGMTAEFRSRLVAMNQGRPITFEDLLIMADVLPMAENYGPHAGVPFMLFGSRYPRASDAASNTRTRSIEPGFAASHSSQELWHRVQGRQDRRSQDERSNAFGWYYSSGVSNLLAQEFRSLFTSHEEYLAFPHVHLFAPIGIHNFTMETDAGGTFIASSFSYGTGRDWALLGQLLLQDGAWKDSETQLFRQIVPKTFVAFMRTPNTHSGGHYGGSVWLNPACVDLVTYDEMPYDQAHLKLQAQQRWLIQTLPPDAYFMSGFLGQKVFVVPSLDLVIVRLAMTSTSDPVRINHTTDEAQSFSTRRFVTDVLVALQQA